MHTILICDDDKDIVSALRIYLTSEGYRTVEACNGEEAIAAVHNHNIDLILMDVMMPKLDGIRATAKLREEGNIPIILLTAKSEDSDKVLGLNIGADDYITKPFSSGELLARVRAALRNNRFSANEGRLPGGKFFIKDLQIDYDARQVYIKGEPIKLTQTEYNIVALLSENCGKMMTYVAILKAIWGDSADEGSIKKLQVNMANIRRKIGDKPGEGEQNYITNELGVGYRLND